MLLETSRGRVFDTLRSCLSLITAPLRTLLPSNVVICMTVFSCRRVPSDLHAEPSPPTIVLYKELNRAGWSGWDHPEFTFDLTSSSASPRFKEMRSRRHAVEEAEHTNIRMESTVTELPSGSKRDADIFRSKVPIAEFTARFFPVFLYGTFIWTTAGQHDLQVTEIAIREQK